MRCGYFASSSDVGVDAPDSGGERADSAIVVVFLSLPVRRAARLEDDEGTAEDRPFVDAPLLAMVLRRTKATVEELGYRN